jgi:hypothetical protein
MQRDGARHAVISVDLRHFQTVEAAVFLQELTLYLDGLAVPLLVAADPQVQRDPLGAARRAVAVRV